jgi:gluconolactonase
VDLATGKLETLYTECNGESLKGPNDLVFDDKGGFYFTDLGKTYGRLIDRGAVFYAKADGSSVTEVVFPMIFPNGTSLSPDGKTLYVAETDSARLWAFPVTGPGKIGRDPKSPAPHGGKLLYGAGGYERYDSMAVEANGNICVATLVNGGISVVDPKGGLSEFWAANEPYCTNVCFGGPDLKTAYATMSGTGKLLAIDWPRPGLKLEHG